MIGVLAALGLGWVWMEWAAPARQWQPRWAGWLLNGSLGLAVGVAVSSLVHFLLLWMGLASRGVLAGALVLLAAPVAVLLARRPRGGTASAAESAPAQGYWVLALVSVALLAVVLAGVVALSNATPHGDWDGWAIWNLRAKFLAGDGTWRNAVSPLAYRSKPDYPLLVPGAVAMDWRLTASVGPEAGRLLALAMGGAVITLLVAGVTLVRTASLGWVAGLMMAASAGYLVQIPAQYADVPLSLMILGAITCILLADRAAGLAEVGGFLAACAAWTKTEGLVFCLLAMGGAAVALRGRTARQVASGATPVLALVVAFKVLVAAPSGYRWAPVTAVLEGGRWAAVLGRFWADLVEWGLGWGHPLLIAVVLIATLGVRPGGGTARRLGLLVGGQAAAYVLVLVLTGENVEFQAAAMPRLMAHLWPAAILLLTLYIRAPEEHAGAEATVKARDRRPPRAK